MQVCVCVCVGRHVSKYAGPASVSCLIAGADPGGVAALTRLPSRPVALPLRGSCYPRRVGPTCVGRYERALVLRDLPLDGPPVVVAAAGGGGSVPARAALISCCTISRNESSEGEMVVAGGAGDVPDEVGGSVAGGGSRPGDAIRSNRDRSGDVMEITLQPSVCRCQLPEPGHEIER